MLDRYERRVWSEGVAFKMRWDEAVSLKLQWYDAVAAAIATPTPAPTPMVTRARSSNVSPTTMGGVPDIIRQAFYAAGQAQWAELAVAVSWCESNWNPSAVNSSSGAIGIFQLLRDGQLDGFYAAGYTNPYDPYQQAEYVASYIAQNQWWGPWKGCL